MKAGTRHFSRDTPAGQFFDCAGSIKIIRFRRGIYQPLIIGERSNEIKDGEFL